MWVWKTKLKSSELRSTTLRDQKSRVGRVGRNWSGVGPKSGQDITQVLSLGPQNSRMVVELL
jgi:hypothetical protein